MADPRRDEEKNRDNVFSPYGPQRGGRADDAAGGADSSPFETVPPEDRPEAKRQGADQHASDPKNE